MGELLVFPCAVELRDSAGTDGTDLGQIYRLDRRMAATIEATLQCVKL